MPALRSKARETLWTIAQRRRRGAIQAPSEPPSCPPGWRTGPPDFVGVGAQRGGTTRWFELLGSHPEIVPPGEAKELHFFDRFYAGGFTPTDQRDYHRYFPRDDGRKVGEWTPLYMSVPEIPRLIASAAPEARLLVLLRDPVERYISGLEHDTRRARAQGRPLSQLAPIEAFARGLYHGQLTNLLTYFDRSRVLILQYEACTHDPLREWRRTIEFLGVTDLEFVPDLESHPNRGRSKPVLDADTRAAYVSAYRADVAKLAEEFPEIDLALWPNFADLADSRH